VANSLLATNSRFVQRRALRRLGKDGSATVPAIPHENNGLKPASNGTGKEPETLQSAGRILDVLLCFTQEKPERSFSELVDELGVNNSVVRRCIATLLVKGFLKQNPIDKKYRLGLVLFELGSLVLPKEELTRVAMPLMQHLSIETRSSAFLTMEDNDQAVCIARVDSPKPLKVTFEVGRRSPLHAGASARVILAYLPEERIKKIIDGHLPRYTDRTLCDPEAILAELHETRKRGYAISTGELDQAVTAIGVPIMGRNGEILASLSISGPVTDFSPERIPALIEATRVCGHKITSLLWGGEG
jgi:IclR family KDG regulon transcriptional repressor